MITGPLHKKCGGPVFLSKQQPAALDVLAPVIAEMREKIPPFAPGITFEDMIQHLSTMKFSDLLKEHGIATGQLDAYEEKLNKLPNI